MTKGCGSPAPPGSPCLHCHYKKDGQSPDTSNSSRKNRSHRRREKAALFHPSLLLLPHKLQHLIFISPKPHCHCPFSLMWALQCGSPMCKATVPPADAHSRAAETSYVSDSPLSPLPFTRLSQLDILVTVFQKQRIGCI